MTITDIVSRNKSKSDIYIDGDFAFVLYKGDFRMYHLCVGEEIPENLYREIMEEVLPKRAKDRSYKLLLSKDYTRRQLREKLKGDGYPEEIIASVMEDLIRDNYLNDSRYAENYIYWKAGGRSRNRMMMDLKQKGIDPDSARAIYDDLLEREDIDPEGEVIQRFLSKKSFDAAEASFEEKEKMKASLYRKGFSLDAINRAIGRR